MKSRPVATTLIAATLCAGETFSKTETVYFGTGKGKGVYVAEFDSKTGLLSAPRLAIELANPGFIAIHPNKQLIYATTAGLDGYPGGGVAALKINADGSLTLINKQPSEGPGPCHVSVDATGQCLLVANYSGGCVAALKINADGSLKKSTSIHQHEGSGTHPKRQGKPYAHSFAINPANTLAYACDLGLDKLMVYKLDPAEATLTPAGFAEVPGGSMGPRHMKWSADGAYAYVVNELDPSVSLFKQGKTDGALEFVKTQPTLAEHPGQDQMTCAEIRIHPNGKFIYASTRELTDRRRDAITLFACADDGFRRIETYAARVSVPRNFNIDPTGTWMLVGGQKSKDIAIFKVDPETGTLAFTGTTVPFNGDPICIEFLN